MSPDRGSLRRAVAIVAFKDAQPFRQAVFDYLASHQPPVRAARAVYRTLGRGRLSTLYVGAYGVIGFLAVDAPTGARVLAVGRYRNEGRQFDYIEGVLGEPIARVDLSTRAALRRTSLRALLRQLRDPGTLREAATLVHRVNLDHADFLVGCRVAETAGCWLRFQQLLAHHDARAVLVSSDSNPYAMAAAEAARAAGLRTVYITHGHIPDGPPELDFDLSIVDGPAVLRVYDDSQGRRGAVAFKGAEGRHRPLDLRGLRADDGLQLGIFMSLIVDWDAFEPLLERLRRVLQPRSILLRLHPNETIRDPAALDRIRRHDGVEVSLGETVLTDDAARCDLVIAGNSSAHLTLLKYGVPTVSLAGMDLVPHDFYRFVQCRIHPHLDRVEDLDPAAIADFYDDPDWADRFREFDASYPDRDLDGAVRQALLALLAQRTPEPS